MALSDFAFRASGIRPRQRIESQRPPAGALANPTFNGLPHQPLWPAYEGPQAVKLARRNLYAAKAIEAIANDISALPFLAGNMASKNPRPTSAMQQLLGPPPGGPNPMWSGAKAINYAVRQWLILGKFAWLHEYDQRGRIIALWPLMAQMIVPVVAPVGAKGYFEKFRYGVQGSPGYREFKPSDITYVWEPSDEDVRLPQSPLDLARYGIKISGLLDQFDDAWLSNGGVPAHMVVTPPFSNDASRTSFRDQFRRKFGGPKRANSAMFAEASPGQADYGSTGGGGGQSVQIQSIATTQKDAQLDVMRDGRIADMCVSWGVPLSRLMDSRLSKFTNMESDRKNYYQSTIRGHLAKIQDGINLALGTLLDGASDIGWFDTTGVPELRKPAVFDATEGLAAVAAGTISPNEYREDRGLPKLPDPEADIAKPRPAAVLRLSDVLGNGADPTAALDAAGKAVAGSDGASVADPVPSANPAGKAAPPPPPTRATAVRTDLLGVVRAQLAVELDAATAELRARLDGKRGGRKRASAQLDLALAYELQHWHTRGMRNMGPALDAAGLDPSEFWADITNAVAEELTGLGPEDAWESVLDVDGLIAVLRPGAPALMLEGAV